MLRVLIADDHPLFRSGLRGLLAKLDDQMSIVEAGNFGDARQRATESAFDLILTDLRMPDMEGFEGIRLLKSAARDTPVVVISGYESKHNAEQALAAGAVGFIPKSSSVEVMLNALKLVRLGEIYMPPSLIYGSQIQADDDASQRPTTPTPRIFDPTLLAPLTHRQYDVLALLGQGKSNKDIADTLGISEGTVKVHVGAILKVLGATNRTQAALMAIDAGIAPSEKPASNLA